VNRRPAPVRLSAAVSTLLAVGLAGCGLLGPEVRPVDPVGNMPQPIGPKVEIGRGESLGIAWRYVVYQSDVGICTEVQLGSGGSSSSCGGAPPGQGQAGSAIALMGISSGTGSPTTIEGFATDEVEEVWIELTDGDRVPATLMALAPAGVDGQVWLAYVPAGRLLQQVVAIGADGDVLAEEPLDNP
jgi:hypothetical protein